MCCAGARWHSVLGQCRKDSLKVALVWGQTRASALLLALLLHQLSWLAQCTMAHCMLHAVYVCRTFASCCSLLRLALIQKWSIYCFNTCQPQESHKNSLLIQFFTKLLYKTAIKFHKVSNYREACISLYLAFTAFRMQPLGPMKESCYTESYISWTHSETDRLLSLTLVLWENDDKESYNE